MMLPTSTEGQATLKASGKKSTEEQVRLKLREIENIKKSITAERAAREAADQKLENIKKSIAAEKAARQAADRKTKDTESQIEVLRRQIALLEAQALPMVQQQTQQDTSLIAAGNPTLSFSGNSNGTHNTNAVPTNRISTPAAIAAKIDIQSPQKGIKAF